MTLEEFEWAKKILDISISMPLVQIEKKYKSRLKQLHPDVSGLEPETAKEKTSDLNRAMNIVREFCKNYQFDFSTEQFLYQHPEERLQKMFWKDIRTDNKA